MADSIVKIAKLLRCVIYSTQIISASFKGTQVNPIGDSAIEWATMLPAILVYVLW
jgi:hypothetical protein